MKTYGIMDLGTNSVRLLIADSDGRRVMPRESFLRSTRLGEGMHREPRLLPAAIERTLKALKEYREILAERKITQVVLAATSAVREALNQQEFLHAVDRELGWTVRILAGEEEGRLSYYGALLGIGGGDAGSLVLDIGGGSTEMAMAAPEGLRRISVKAGAVRLSQGGWTESSLDDLLRPAIDLFLPLAPSRIIGVGGTITTLAAMELGLTDYDSKLVTGRFIPQNRVCFWRERLAALDLEGRRSIPGLQPERADIIPAGLSILDKILREMGIAGVVSDDWDLLHQLCLEQGKSDCDS